MPNRKQLKGITFSTTAPASPIKGDIWYETDSAGAMLYGFPWTWNGTYWLSPEKSWVANYFSEMAQVSHQFAVDARFNYLITTQTAVMYSDMAGTASNFWYLAVQKTFNGGQTQFSLNFNTTSLAAATWRNQGIQTHNQFVNPIGEGIVCFRIFAIKNGLPGSLWGGSELFYQLARK